MAVTGGTATCFNCEFDEWYRILEKICEMLGERIPNADVVNRAFVAGMTPKGLVDKLIDEEVGL